MSDSDTHVIVLPGGGYAEFAPHEGESVARWLTGTGIQCDRISLPAQRPAPCPAERAPRRDPTPSHGRRPAHRGMGFSAGGHLAGLAALSPGAAPEETVQFAVLGYAITSMETETYRPSRLILLGQDASPNYAAPHHWTRSSRPGSPPFFLGHTAEDHYVPPEHTYRLALGAAANRVPHAVHVFAHGPHSLGLARGAGGRGDLYYTGRRLDP